MELRDDKRERENDVSLTKRKTGQYLYLTLQLILIEIERVYDGGISFGIYSNTTQHVVVVVVNIAPNPTIDTIDAIGQDVNAYDSSSRMD
jgi:hypothetical protein